MPADLTVIIPTRGRPDNVRKVISAWDFTNAWDCANLVLAADSDDPEIQRYRDLVAEMINPDTGDWLVYLVEFSSWLPMVHKLNRVAASLALDGHFALGFAGDDHLPRTIGWARRYLDVLREIGTGMVYGDDGYQGAKLSTEWAITSDVVRTLGVMVPAPVEHMYSDVSLLELTHALGIARHLPEVQIEHMHPIVKKAPNDPQYQRVNSRKQFHEDRKIYEKWRGKGQMAAQIRDLTAELNIRPPAPATEDTRTARSRPAVSRKVNAMRAPDIFRKVRGATPDKIGLVLAHLAGQVPADQAVVELGVFQGRTALLMAWGARQGLKAHVWGIDAWDLAGNDYGPPFTDPATADRARRNVRTTRYESYVTLIRGFSVIEAEQWPGPPVGLLFIDGDHSCDGARGDFLAWRPHLAPGAMVAFDDHGHPDWPGVAEAVDSLVSEGAVQPVEIFHERLAVTRAVEG